MSEQTQLVAVSDDEIIEAWLEGRPLTTKQIYGRALKKLRMFTAKPLRDITPNDLDEFAAWLPFHFAESTTSSVLHAISSLMGYIRGDLRKRAPVLTACEKCQGTFEAPYRGLHLCPACYHQLTHCHEKGCSQPLSGETGGYCIHHAHKHIDLPPKQCADGACSNWFTPTIGVQIWCKSCAEKRKRQKDAPKHRLGRTCSLCLTFRPGMPPNPICDDNASGRCSSCAVRHRWIHRPKLGPANQSDATTTAIRRIPTPQPPDSPGTAIDLSRVPDPATFDDPSAWIRATAQALGLSLPGLSRLCDSPGGRMSNLSRVRTWPLRRTLVKIADKLGVPVESLEQLWSPSKDLSRVPDPTTFDSPGEWIQETARALNLSLARLSLVCDLRNDFMCDIISARSRPIQRNLEKIAGHLGVAMESLEHLWAPSKTGQVLHQGQKPPDDEELIKACAKGRSPTTAWRYDRAVRLLRGFTPKPLAALTDGDLDVFFAWLQPHYAKPTVDSLARAIRSLILHIQGEQPCRYCRTLFTPQRTGHYYHSPECEYKASQLKLIPCPTTGCTHLMHHRSERCQACYDKERAVQPEPPSNMQDLVPNSTDFQKFHPYFEAVAAAVGVSRLQVISWSGIDASHFYKVLKGDNRFSVDAVRRLHEVYGTSIPELERLLEGQIGRPLPRANESVSAGAGQVPYSGEIEGQLTRKATVWFSSK